MSEASFHQEIQFLLIKLYEVSRNIFRNLGSPMAMLRIVMIIVSPQIVNESEVLHHTAICTRVSGQGQAIMTDPGPVRCTVNAIPIEPELLAGERDQLFRY